LPVDVVAVMVALPAATAVTRHAPALTAAVATVALLDVQLASVVLAAPPVIWTAKLSVSPTFMFAFDGEMLTDSAGDTGAGTVTSSPQAPSATRAPRLRATSALFREKSCINPPLARSWR